MLPPNEMEQDVLAALRAGVEPGEDAKTRDDLTAMGLALVLHAGRRVRAARLEDPDGTARMKAGVGGADDSPATQIERDIEAFTRVRLTAVHGTAFLGEEEGGEVSEKAKTAAMDPIDGTWSFLLRTETCTCCLAFIENNDVVSAMVMNPATGELAYAEKGGRTRLVQVSGLGEGDQAYFLPFPRHENADHLVNCAPRRESPDVIAALFEAWDIGTFGTVKLPGGSPSWAFVEAAKGSYVYTNTWKNQLSEPFDLGPGCLLMRGAGGDVVDISGNSIDPLTHVGPFVAGIDPEGRERVAEIIRKTRED